MEEIIKELTQEIINLKQRVKALETQTGLSIITFPDDGSGKLVLPKHTGTPTAITARIGYNQTTNKMIVCENGVWKTVTTT